MVEVHTKEKQAFTQGYSADELAAGADKIEQFGVMNIVLFIAEKFGYKFDEVLELPYNLVFMTMYKDKVASSIKNKMYKIAIKKK